MSWLRRVRQKCLSPHAWREAGSLLSIRSGDGRETMAGDHRVMCRSAGEEEWFGNPLFSTLQLEKHAVPLREAVKCICPVAAGEKKQDFNSRILWFVRSACKDRFKSNANQHKCFSHSSSPEKELINHKITLKPMYIKIFISQSFTKPTLKSHFVASYFVTTILIPLWGVSSPV